MLQKTLISNYMLTFQSMEKITMDSTKGPRLHLPSNLHLYVCWVYIISIDKIASWKPEQWLNLHHKLFGFPCHLWRWHHFTNSNLSTELIYVLLRMLLYHPMKPECRCGHRNGLHHWEPPTASHSTQRRNHLSSPCTAAPGRLCGSP